MGEMLDNVREGADKVANAYFKLMKSTAKQPFRFTLHAANHENILRSESYTAKAAALNGIVSVRENAPIDARYKRKQATNGEYMFNLTARNGQVIGSSELYKTKSGRENGIESVKRNAPSAELRDET